MESQQFIAKLQQLPISPIPYVNLEQCNKLNIVIVGTPELVVACTSELEQQQANVLMTLVHNNSSDTLALEATLAGISIHDLDILVLASSHNLLLIEALARFRAKLALYQAKDARSDHANIALLADDISKRVMQQQFDMLQQNFYFDGFSVEAGEQYTHPVVHAMPGEKILCIGPYLGNPFKFFAKTSAGDFTAHTLEANPYTYAELCSNLVSWGLHKQVRPVCAGAWSSTGMVAFASEGHTGGGNVLELTADKTVKPGDIDMAIFTYAVDDYVAETGFIPTLIESGRIGIATEVIKGARQTIIEYKPKLILLDYPDSDSVRLINAWVPEYKIYYSECGRQRYGVFFLTL
ncbi:hypothetical protein [Rheinheimera nanhaiensis]|uniref:Uncharacterized protein n=1 Tax=Rheinheimera nanhaiensis E407-8 TaxID=562729 RepID=I1DWK6_9GAMM|nr:hypothetical protein [Rheinheimera nanhaiensis]GAB58434.1 hypothetical protein RNAN_1406 [Rheinheimera nanhaiensis E407-8]